VFSGLPAGGPTPGIFFTRWVTNFCAPGFVFLAGTGAYLYGRKLGNVASLQRYLVARGAILIFLELTLIRIGWTFNFDFAHYMLAGVIWMLGCCMILLATMVNRSIRTIAIIGVVVIFAQQLLGAVARASSSATIPVVQPLFHIFYTGGSLSLSGGGEFVILYVLVPWIGVMAAGYAFGSVMERERVDRDRLCLRIGLGASAVFVFIGTIGALRNPGGEHAAPLLFRILGQQKYPASQLFLMMTLGPIIAVIPLAERARGWFVRQLEVFGRVPMFYYLLHIPVIHALAVVVSLVREGAVSPWLFGSHPMRAPDLPPAYAWSLGLLYLVFGVAIIVLYIPCRWYAGLKAQRRHPWLRFL